MSSGKGRNQIAPTLKWELEQAHFQAVYLPQYCCMKAQIPNPHHCNCPVYHQLEVCMRMNPTKKCEWVTCEVKIEGSANQNSTKKQKIPNTMEDNMEDYLKPKI